MSSINQYLRKGFESSSFPATAFLYFLNGAICVLIALALYYVTGTTRYLWILPFVCGFVTSFEYRSAFSIK